MAKLKNKYKDFEYETLIERVFERYEDSNEIKEVEYDYCYRTEIFIPKHVSFVIDAKGIDKQSIFAHNVHPFLAILDTKSNTIITSSPHLIREEKLAICYSHENAKGVIEFLLKIVYGQTN